MLFYIPIPWNANFCLGQGSRGGRPGMQMAKERCPPRRLDCDVAVDDLWNIVLFILLSLPPLDYGALGSMRPITICNLRSTCLVKRLSGGLPALRQCHCNNNCLAEYLALCFSQSKKPQRQACKHISSGIFSTLWRFTSIQCLYTSLWLQCQQAMRMSEAQSCSTMQISVKTSNSIVDRQNFGKEDIALH